MFSAYQFPLHQFESRQWPLLGFTSGPLVVDEYFTEAERRDILLAPVIR